jgi:hypothetical protein
MNVKDYLGKRCFVRPFACYDWFFTRKIRRIRLRTSMRYGPDYYEVQVRNWFWMQWMGLDEIAVIQEVYE